MVNILVGAAKKVNNLRTLGRILFLKETIIYISIIAK